MKFITNSKVVLSFEEQKELFKRMQLGDLSAREELIKTNMGLVGEIVKNIKKVYSLEDAAQDGLVGLINAVDTYDVESGVKFSSYACRCIINFIELAKRKHINAFGMPESLVRKYAVYKATVQKLQQKLLREPTSNEIYEEMLNAFVKINEGRQNDIKLDLETVEMLPALFEETASLNAPIEYDTDTEFVDMYSLYDNSPEDLVIDRHVVHDLLNETDLSEECMMVIRMRYGFDGVVYTQKAIGEILGVSRARVGQLEQKALKKLRNKSNYLESVSKSKRR